MTTALLTGIIGSRAYGLARPDSDTDTLSVHLRPTEDFLGLRPPQLSEVRQGEGRSEDSASHELGKYLSMVLACNPTAAELLWLPEDLYLTMTDTGRELIGMRSGFLFAKGVRNSYLGYAHAQAKRCRRRDFATPGRQEKAARHTYRLTRSGVHLWRTGELLVAVEDREAVMEFGARVAAGDESLLDQMLTETEDAFAQPTVLAESNEDARREADTWLRAIRIQALSEHRDTPTFSP